ncbi:MAG: lysophospholipid acyltransferase family protein [Flavobacteriales bacterium]|nr:lysophospholipid acyltransferase family protein [Flavobacteriales bacterium]MCB9196339.1 lysophospholipid acyltransferase family protein [Flavobacteriales bacterium]
MEELVSIEDIKQATGIKREKIAKLTQKTLKLGAINEMYAQLPKSNPLEFIDSLLDLLGIHVEISEESLNNIPAEGGFISIANHPFGGLDGIILLKIMLAKRPDFKVMANKMLLKIDPLKEVIIPVNPFENQEDPNFSGLRKTIELINENIPVGFFPAGEVSSWHSDKRKITDKPWNKSLIRIIHKAEKPVLPIYFDGQNSPLFYSLAMLHPLLQTAKLPSELTNKKNKTIKVIIGKPIIKREQQAFTNVEKFSKYLRTRTYCLGASINHQKFYKLKFERKPTSISTNFEAIEPFLPQEKVAELVKQLPKSSLLFTSTKYHLYCACAEDMGLLIDEIGKLREYTFRAIGEGTGKSKDIDEFDLYYHHLFIWDADEQQIVGSYRIGDGRDISKQYGKHGFYVSTLFKWKEEFNDVLSQSVELGRSFIQPAYQKTPQSLFMLWKGILYFLLKNDHCRYLVGPVSISNDYSKISKSLIIKYIRRNYFNNFWAKNIKARRKFRYRMRNSDIEINDLDANDLDKLDKIIENVEPNHFKIPILLKKYLKQNAKFIGFNLDPAFNNCLDGLILLDLREVDVDTVYALSKEMNDENIIARIQNMQKN